jgi:EPS-associated MarR family transcriptional regulator
VNNNTFMKISQQQFDALRKIFNNPSATQRQLAKDLQISLGKLNYVVNELRKKGLIKIGNFQKNQNKSRYLYLLTPRGISEKSNLTINFMKRKLKEYDELKKEIESTDIKE